MGPKYYIINQKRINNIILIFLIIFSTNIINSYIILPLEYLPEENYKYKEDSHAELMKHLYYKKLITKFEIGTPKKTQTLLIDTSSNQYYFDSLNPVEKPQEQCIPSEIYKFENKEYYNETLSNSYNIEKCETVKYESYNYDEICYSRELLTFNVDGNITDLEFPIKVIKNHNASLPGFIGLAINNSLAYNERSFLTELKLKNLINDYFWFFDFDKFSPLDKIVKGKFVVGDLPHKIFPKKYSEEDYVQTSSYRGSSFWTLKMSNVYIENKTDEYHLSNTQVTLFYEFYNVIGTKEFLSNIKSHFLKELLDNKKCFEGSFSQDIYSDSDLSFYYCDLSTKDILYENLPNIKFVSKELKYTFELTKEELFYIKGDYIYFMVFFMKSYYNNWVIGQMLTSKYHFVFHTDQGQIGFYQKVNIEEENPISQGRSNFGIYIIISGLCFTIIGVIIGIIIGKNYCDKKGRKPRGNELEDYEYPIKEDNIN